MSSEPAPCARTLLADAGDEPAYCGRERLGLIEVDPVSRGLDADPAHAVAIEQSAAVLADAARDAGDIEHGRAQRREPRGEVLALAHRDEIERVAVEHLRRREAHRGVIAAERELGDAALVDLVAHRGEAGGGELGGGDRGGLAAVFVIAAAEIAAQFGDRADRAAPPPG